MKIHQGDIWLVDFNPTKGHEQSGIRPAVVVSVDEFHNSAAELVFVCPLTTKKKGIDLHVKIGPETGVDQISYIKSEDARSLSVERLIRRIGGVDWQTMKSVRSLLKILLGIG